MGARSPHLLHVFSTFAPGGPQIRAARLINAWGGRYRHSIVSVNPGELGARELLDRSIDAAFPVPPPLKAGGLAGRLSRIRRWIARLQPDLLLTYNWGAMEIVMSRQLFGGPPLVHHEDGFGPDEAAGQLKRRVWFRQLALPAAARLVVPSRFLERIALEIWRQPPGRIARIANGVAFEAFDAEPDGSALDWPPSTSESPVIGTVALLRREKNLPRLVRAFAAATRDTSARLVIVGDGPERETVLREALACNVAERVQLPGFLPHPQRYLRTFDVFAMSSDTEQFPISLAEAMAAGLPAVATNVGDIGTMVSEANRPFIVPVEDERALAEAIGTMLGSRERRQRIGAANRVVARRDLSLQQMVGKYAAVYAEALGSEFLADAIK